MRLRVGAIGSAASIALMALASNAWAQGVGAPITPGGANVTFSSASDLGNSVPGNTSTLLNTTSGTFNVPGGGATTTLTKGTFISEVYQENSGTLDFYYQFTNDSTSTSALTTFSVSDFTGFISRVGYTTSAVGSTVASNYTSGGPDFANETNGKTDAIQFDFSEITPSGGVAPGGTSVTLLISTNATQYTTSSASLQGPPAANPVVFSPVLGSAAAPEPGTLALIVPGALGVVGLIRRRKSA